jgi:hypothetical protein
MADTPMFPIPNSARIEITSTGPHTFDLQCDGLNKSDHDSLVGFFCNMRGRFGAFRFEYGSHVHASCRFDSDSMDSLTRDSVTLPIKILG